MTKSGVIPPTSIVIATYPFCHSDLPFLSFRPTLSVIPTAVEESLLLDP